MSIAAIFVATNAALGPVAVIVQFGNTISYDLGIPRYYLTMMYALYFFIGSFCGVFLKKYIHRIEIRTLVLISSMLSGGGQWLCYISTSPAQLFFEFALLVATFGSAPFFSPLSVYAMKVFKGSRTVAVAFATAGQLTSFGAWRVIFDLLNVQNWREAFQVTSLYSTLILISCALFLRPLLRERRVIKSASQENMKNMRVARFIGLSFCAVTLSGTCFINSIPILSTYGLGTMTTLVFSFMALIGRLGLAFVSDRNMPVILLIALSSMIISTFLALIAINSEMLQFSIFILFGFGYGGVPPLLISYAILWSSEPERVSGNMFQWASCGLFIGAMLSGWMLSSKYIDLLNFFSFTASVIAGLVVLTLELNAQYGCLVHCRHLRR